MDSPARVLIVDRSMDCREVLRTLLERRGAETFEASTVRSGLEAARRERPDLIVLDADDAGHAASESTRELAAEAAGANTPIVVLGTLKRAGMPCTTGVRLAKPYHYGELIRKIETLLGKTG